MTRFVGRNQPRRGRVPRRRPAAPIPVHPDTVVPAYVGEFGLKLRFWVPYVAGLGAVIVEHEAGEEALFPFAREHRIVPGVHDDSRIYGPGDRDHLYLRRFVPSPHVPQNIKADVVISPRKRNHGSAKNWPHWDAITELPGVFAAGVADSSYDVQVPRAWDYARPLDASIEAMRSARLCIATDAGLAHLAVLCGTPLLLITYQGLVAPGPVANAHNREIQPAYWEVQWDRYYTSANHTGAHLEMIDGWEYPERVLHRAKELLGC